MGRGLDCVLGVRGQLFQLKRVVLGLPGFLKRYSWRGSWPSFHLHLRFGVHLVGLGKLPLVHVPRRLGRELYQVRCVPRRVCVVVSKLSQLLVLHGRLLFANAWPDSVRNLPSRQLLLDAGCESMCRVQQQLLLLGFSEGVRALPSERKFDGGGGGKHAYKLRLWLVLHH